MTLRSNGCHSCRRMKVKCDEAKPQCTRCRKAGRVCPGYRDALDMMFLSMNATVEAKVVRPTKMRSALTSSSPLPQLCTSPSTNWEQHAIVHFIDHFTECPGNGALGYLEFLPEMLMLGSECLREAVLAASLANLANISRMRQLESMSHEHYGQALRALRTAMNEKATATADETLTAMYILQKHELISGTRNLLGDPHGVAITAMFRLRETTQLDSHNGLSLYRVTEMEKQIEALSGDPTTTIPTTDGNAFQHSAPGLVFWSLLREASALSSQIKLITRQNLSGSSPPDAFFNQLLLQTYSVYSRLLTWPSSVPESIKYQVLAFRPPTGSFKDTDHIPESIFLFRSAQNGAMFVVYWCACIHLAQSLLQGCRLFHTKAHSSSNDRVLGVPEADIRKSLLETIGNICASAPCLLGDVDRWGQLNVGNKGKALGGFFLLRALSVANSVEGLPISLRRSLLDLFGRVGTSFGILHALRLREIWLASHTTEAGELLN
ncbi:hypothetical protein K504DRAFT_123351 [Pleomassaria siparia CBS 279.74]|uniref:Zn(2)-C6 fungal-type domain-containing protein n=1 Tax=Pleomassaria siparia CBS 279.74 TaxID=1314801 RepID=A0A6G1KJ70_9PLEO|nr:hypothetical protein K504DRAFT_123351 [Pleomassaria siparia CBS 279.74]